MKTNVTVTLKDGTTHTAEIRNPDRVRWDMAASHRGWPQVQDAPFLFATYIAWSALKREGKYTGDWENFAERDCLEAELSNDTSTTAEGDATPL